MSVKKAGTAGNVWGLSRAIKHPDGRVQKQAAVALGHLGPAAEAAIPGLIKTLRAERAPNKVYVYPARQEAAKALGRIGPAAESAVPALIEVLQEESPGAVLVHEAAVTALGDIGQPAELVVPALIQALQHANLVCTRVFQSTQAAGRGRKTVENVGFGVVETLLGRWRQIKRSSCGHWFVYLLPRLGANADTTRGGAGTLRKPLTLWVRISRTLGACHARKRLSMVCRLVQPLRAGRPDGPSGSRFR